LVFELLFFYPSFAFLWWGYRVVIDVFFAVFAGYFLNAYSAKRGILSLFVEYFYNGLVAKPGFFKFFDVIDGLFVQAKRKTYEKKNRQKTEAKAL